MKTILVPTDFSKNAFVAAQYAASLAQVGGYKLHLYHVYIVLYSGFEEKGVSVQHVEWADEEAKKAMSSLLSTIQEQYPGLEVEGECVRGFMIDALTNKLKDDDSIALLVMGTKGVTNVAESVFGSTTYEVLKKVSIPIIVIPEDTPDFSLNHVGFFTDYNDYELDAFDQMAALLPGVKSCDVIHFTKIGADNTDKRERWRLKAEAAHTDLNVGIKEVEVEGVDINSVIDVAVVHALDLMVFTRPHKPFFERVFVKSLTKAVANYPVIPSLFIKE